MMKFSKLGITILLVMLCVSMSLGFVSATPVSDIQKSEFNSGKYTYFYPTTMKYTPDPLNGGGVSSEVIDTWRATKTNDICQSYIATSNNQHIRGLTLLVEKRTPYESGDVFFDEYYNQLKKGFYPYGHGHGYNDGKGRFLSDITVLNGNTLYYEHSNRTYDGEYTTYLVEGCILKGDTTYHFTVTETSDYYQSHLNEVFQIVKDSFKINSN